MKYNLSKIMKRAWELIKKAGMTLSSGLKKAWKEAKEVVKMKGSDKQIAWAMDIKNDCIKAIDEVLQEARKDEKYNPNNPKVVAAEKLANDMRDAIENCVRSWDIIKYLSNVNLYDEPIRKYSFIRHTLKNVEL